MAAADGLLDQYVDAVRARLVARTGNAKAAASTSAALRASLEKRARAVREAAPGVGEADAVADAVFALQAALEAEAAGRRAPNPTLDRYLDLLGAHATHRAFDGDRDAFLADVRRLVEARVDAALARAEGAPLPKITLDVVNAFARPLDAEHVRRLVEGARAALPDPAGRLADALLAVRRARAEETRTLSPAERGAVKPEREA